MRIGFVTEFGHEIEVVPEYFERNLHYVAYVEQQSKAFKGEKSSHSGERMPFNVPAKDLVNFSGTLAFLRAYGLLGEWDRGIDIGGAEGTCIALMKAAGFIQHATNLDILDYSGVTGPDYFDNFIKFMRNLPSDTTDEGAAAREAIQRAKHSFDYFPNESLMYGMYDDFVAPATVDENLHLGIYEATGKYDFISAYNCFELFDLDRALAKVRELLTDDGLFVCQDGYWWFPINSVGFVGHFPYVTQRLTWKDLQRYGNQFHPSLIDGLLLRYPAIYEGKHRPTLNDWFLLARKHGLRAIALERIVPKQHHRVTDDPSFLFLQESFDHREVLRDIHQHKPDVTVDDLFTSGIRIAMVPA